jgi:hypothetical protein
MHETHEPTQGYPLPPSSAAGGVPPQGPPVSGKAYMAYAGVAVALALLGPGLMGLVARFVMPSNSDATSLVDSIVASAEDSETKAIEILRAVKGMEACFAGGGTSTGPDTEACREAINGRNVYPQSSQRVLVALHAKPSTGAQFRGLGEGAADWEKLPGAGEIAAHLKSLGGMFAELPPGEIPPDVKAQVVLAILESRLERYTAVSSYAASNSETFMKEAFTFAVVLSLYFLALFALTLVHKGFLQAAGWRKALFGLGFALVFLAAMHALDAGDSEQLLSMKEVGKFMRVDGDEGLSALIGLPFVIVGSVLDFLSSLPGLIFTKKFVLLMASFFLVTKLLTAGSGGQVVALAYLTLIVAPAYDPEPFHVFREDLGVLDASIVLGALFWAFKYGVLFCIALSANALYRHHLPGFAARAERACGLAGR